jgi:hypothetical protein
MDDKGASRVKASDAGRELRRPATLKKSRRRNFPNKIFLEKGIHAKVSP